MLLTDYTIQGKGKQKQIDLNNPELQNLQDYLNQDIRDPFFAEGVLINFNEIRDNWDNIENFAENNYGGIWDEYEMELYNLTGNWFMSIHYPDFSFLVDVDNIYIYIYNTMIPSYPRVGLPLDDFIDILEQWKDL